MTGAGGGIGREVVVDFVNRGYSVLCWGRHPPIDRVAGADYVVCDVSDPVSVENATLGLRTRYKRVDVLVTSAAILKTMPLHRMTDDVWNEMISINLTGVFRACRAVLPFMIEQGGGSIVNLSSVHAIATVPGTGAYAATKGGIISLSRQIAVEYADHGIRSNSLVVGSVDTAMSTLHGEELTRDSVTVVVPEGTIGRMADPREIARAVAFLAGDDASFVNGAAFTVDGGLTSRLM
ncbi:SDR family NAD(P)-dependent oxidoreductase [Paramicrobacterium chengjingii]|uniref:SDR family NAD(P)-dependent oxidoreductase n=1 Tax=Paramicrobacterium chengjingii TaxID=2769067 RepID=UPI0014231E7A|nr:SDR family oxidoreductase [Microbacterium chengjingii]